MGLKTTVIFSVRRHRWPSWQPSSARAGGEGPAAPDELDEIVVTATLRPQSRSTDTARQHFGAVDAQALRDAGQQHFEDVLPLVPNLNWAGDTSRPRYFQIRGIGELQQYQGAPNPSVGLPHR